MTEESIENKLWLWRPPKDGYIGRRGLRPKEAPEKVSGRAVYTNDIYLPGMLYVKIYRSPYAHAKIKSMDSSKAEALPGVWTIIRYDDPDVDFSEPHKEMLGFMWHWWRDSILPDTADFQGVRVGAMVVADSEEVCDQALKLIGEGIEWEQMHIILDPEEAAQPNAPIMHPELNPTSNVWKDVVILNQGDVEKGFASSDNVIEFYESKRDDDIWAGVEPGCIVAQWKGEELELWYHGQFVGEDLAAMISPALKSGEGKPSKLKVHTPYNGGTFGGNTKGYVAHLCRYAVIAAKKTLRPVKVVDDYGMSWEGISYEVGTARYKVGFNNDGTIVAIKIDVYQKSGIPITEKFVDSLKTPNILLHEIHSYWSRGHEHCWKDGAVNCTFVNLIINRVAAHLGMDQGAAANGKRCQFVSSPGQLPEGCPFSISNRALPPLLTPIRGAYRTSHRPWQPGESASDHAGSSCRDGLAVVPARPSSALTDAQAIAASVPSMKRRVSCTLPLSSTATFTAPVPRHPRKSRVWSPS